MGDDVTQNGPEEHSNGKDDKTTGNQVEKHKMKPELAKRRICEVLGTGLFILALCIHGFWFWIFMFPGAVACGYSLRLEVKHFGYKKPIARFWGITLFCIMMVGSLIYWLQAEHSEVEIKEAIKDALPTNMMEIVVGQTNYFNETNIVIQTNQPIQKEWEPPPFYVECNTCAGCGIGQPPGFFIVENGRITPIFLGLLVNFVNRTDTQILINSYSLETKTTNGTWEQINYKTMGWGGKIYAGNSLKNVKEWKFVTFDEVIQSNISPGQTIRGWLFCSKPYETYTFRFSFIDSTERYFAPQPVRHPYFSQGFPTFSVQSPLLEVSTNIEDISSLPINQ